MTNPLIQQLRMSADGYHADREWGHATLLRNAADEIERCRSGTDALREALDKIANGRVPDDIGEDDVTGQCVWQQDVARAALKAGAAIAEQEHESKQRGEANTKERT